VTADESGYDTDESRDQSGRKMDAEFGSALAEWHEFFSTIAGVSGTLIGLLFVALGLNPSIMADDGPTGLRLWSAQTFHSLLVLLVIGLAGLVPARAGNAFVITLVIVGVQGILRVIANLRRLVADRDPEWNLRQGLLRFVSPTLAYVACLLLAYGAWVKDPDALSWLIAIVFLLTMNAASSCWDLLKEIGAKQREAG
jgi:hypothetical protein